MAKTGVNIENHLKQTKTTELGSWSRNFCHRKLLRGETSTEKSTLLRSKAFKQPDNSMVVSGSPNRW